MPDALRRTIAAIDAETIVVSYNDESWITLDELREMCASRGEVVALGFESQRYVGAKIGIHSPAGVKVGTVSHTRNREYVIVAGPPPIVRRMTEPFAGARVDRSTGACVGS
jgi:adenine-specific DNA-methyltransferase